LLASSISNRPPNCRRPKKKSIGEKCGLGEVLVIQKGREWGIAHIDGSILVPVIYEKIDALTDGFFRVEEGGFFGLMDMSGRWIIPPNFSWIQPGVNGTWHTEKEKYYDNGTFAGVEYWSYSQDGKNKSQLFEYNYNYSGIRFIQIAPDLFYAGYGGGSMPYNSWLMTEIGQTILVQNASQDKWASDLKEAEIHQHANIFSINHDYMKDRVSEIRDINLNILSRFPDAFTYHQPDKFNPFFYFTSKLDDNNKVQGIMNYNGEILLSAELLFIQNIGWGDHFIALDDFSNAHYESFAEARKAGDYRGQSWKIIDLSNRTLFKFDSDILPYSIGKDMICLGKKAERGYTLSVINYLTGELLAEKPSSSNWW
jgi:hypothetical protein